MCFDLAIYHNPLEMGVSNFIEQFFMNPKVSTWLRYEGISNPSLFKLKHNSVLKNFASHIFFNRLMW